MYNTCVCLASGRMVNVSEKSHYVIRMEIFLLLMSATLLAGTFAIVFSSNTHLKNAIYFLPLLIVVIIITFPPPPSIFLSNSTKLHTKKVFLSLSSRKKEKNFFALFCD